jgi:integrase
MPYVCANRKRWRVSFTLQMNGQQSRRWAYCATREEAEQLIGSLAQLEVAARTSLAPVGQIDEWVCRGWLRLEESLQVFCGYENTLKGKPTRRTFGRFELMEAFAAHVEKRSRSRKSAGTRIGRARQVLDWLVSTSPDLSALTARQVEAYRDGLLKEGLAPWTVFHYLTALRGLLDQAEDLGMGPPLNVAREVSLRQPKRLEERRILTPEEIGWLLGVWLQPAHRNWIRGGLPTVVRLGLYAGLRNQEMCWLQWDRVDWGRGILTITEAGCEATGRVWVPKGGEIRRIDAKDSCMA